MTQGDFAMKARNTWLSIALFCLGFTCAPGARHPLAAEQQSKAPRFPPAQASFYPLNVSPTVQLPSHAAFKVYIEVSQEAKREYRLLIQSQGLSILYVEMQLSYDGKPVFEGPVVDFVGPFGLGLVQIKLDAPVTTDRSIEQRTKDQEEGKTWAPPVITKFKASYK
jgi:hypothetical protein